MISLTFADGQVRDKARGARHQADRQPLSIHPSAAHRVDPATRPVCRIPGAGAESQCALAGTGPLWHEFRSGSKQRLASCPMHTPLLQ